MKNLLLALTALLMIAAVLGPGRFGAAIAEGGAAEDAAEVPAYVRSLEDGALAEVDLDGGEAEYRFTAPTGSVYDVWLFPAGEEPPEVRARLWRGDKLVAEGEGGMPAQIIRMRQLVRNVGERRNS